MVAIRTRFSWLMVILLVIALTGQTASASVMSCRGTASCCCQPRTVATDMADAVANGMSHDTPSACCETAPSQPCDIASNGPPERAPFLLSVSIDRVDGYAFAGPVFSPVVSTEMTSLPLADTLPRSDRDGPPLYLVIQSFLC